MRAVEADLEVLYYEVFGPLEHDVSDCLDEVRPKMELLRFDAFILRLISISLSFTTHLTLALIARWIITTK